MSLLDGAQSKPFTRSRKEQMSMEVEAKQKDGTWVPSQKQNLAALVSYQTGSVLSRTIINRKAGTITLFAFDEGNCLSEHTTP